MQDVSSPVGLPALYCTQDIPFLLHSMRYFIFHMISPTHLLQYYISELPNISDLLSGVQVSAPYQAMLQL